MKRFRSSFSMRGFISLLMAFCFAGLAVSGIIMYIAPPCSIAESMNWTIMSLSKVQWSSMHQVSALFILVLVVIHLFIYNWRTFKCHFKKRKRKKESGEIQDKRLWRRMYFPVEVTAALVAAVILYAGAVTLIAPFGWLHEGGDYIKEHYRREMPEGTGRGSGTGQRDGRSSVILPGEESRNEFIPGQEGLWNQDSERRDERSSVQGKWYDADDGRNAAPDEISGSGAGRGTAEGQGYDSGGGRGTGEGPGSGSGVGRGAGSEEGRGSGEGRRRTVETQ